MTYTQQHKPSCDLLQKSKTIFSEDAFLDASDSDQKHLSSLFSQEGKSQAWSYKSIFTIWRKSLFTQFSQSTNSCISQHRQQTSDQQNMPKLNLKFSIHFTSMKFMKLEQMQSIFSPQHSESSSTDYSQRLTDIRADISTYSCTYYDYTQCFNTLSKLQKHKHKSHHQFSLMHTQFSLKSDFNLSSTTALAVRNC